LIRAHWASHGDEEHYSSVYELSNFIKPGLLEACRESRGVALKAFDKIAHHIVYRGDRLNERDLWANFATDTFYFTNYPDRPGLLTTLRKLARYNHVDSKAKVKGIRNIAWDRKELWRLLANRVLTTIETPLIYQIVQDHPALREIDVVVKPNDKYVEHPKPHEYELYELDKDKPYAKLKLAKIPFEPTVIIPTAFDCSPPMAKEDKEQFEKWKEGHAEWKEPVFTFKRLLKKSK
jgi:hypothetical protein